MVYVPFLSEPSVERRKLWKRKGGGGGGRGGGGGGGRGGGGSSSSGGRSVSTASGTKTSSTFSPGGGTVSSIPAGSAFAGRSIGGGTRTDVYGSRAYGSGYPGVAGRGVAGRGFPFYYWPIAFGAGGLGYHYHSEYGHPRNGSRPGGPLVVARYVSNDPQTTFRLLADKESIEDVNEVIKENCGSSISGDVEVTDYDGADVEPPRPEEVIQYYRASSVALSLDGYNNTVVFEPENSTSPDVPLPSNIHQELLSCLNSTIGQAVPLVNGAGPVDMPPSFAVFGLVGLVWMLTSQL